MLWKSQIYYIMPYIHACILALIIIILSIVFQIKMCNYNGCTEVNDFYTQLELHIWHDVANQQNLRHFNMLVTLFIFILFPLHYHIQVVAHYSHSLSFFCLCNREDILFTFEFFIIMDFFLLMLLVVVW